jgi:hypothetical protein
MKTVNSNKVYCGSCYWYKYGYCSYLKFLPFKVKPHWGCRSWQYKNELLDPNEAHNLPSVDEILKYWNEKPTNKDNWGRNET